MKWWHYIWDPNNTWGDVLKALGIIALAAIVGFVLGGVFNSETAGIAVCVVAGVIVSQMLLRWSRKRGEREQRVE